MSGTKLIWHLRFIFHSKLDPYRRLTANCPVLCRIEKTWHRTVSGTILITCWKAQSFPKTIGYVFFLSEIAGP